MTSYRLTRIVVSNSDENIPQGYTRVDKIPNLQGVVSENIHVHLGRGWYECEGVSEIQWALAALSMNSGTVVVTLGRFNPEISNAILIR